MTRRTADPLNHQLDRLQFLSLDELRHEWTQLYPAGTPRISRELLILGLAYRVQERVHGGLSRGLLRKLESIDQSLRATDVVEVKPTATLKPGSRLVREWRGRIHVVTVAENGYEHEGAIHESLSVIAEKITGAHWSGPRFFGLPRARPKSEGARSRD